MITSIYYYYCTTLVCKYINTLHQYVYIDLLHHVLIYYVTSICQHQYTTTRANVDILLQHSIIDSPNQFITVVCPTVSLIFN